MEEQSLVERLRVRAYIRRQIPTRKSVQENKPDRLADLLEEAAEAIEKKDEMIHSLRQALKFMSRSGGDCHGGVGLMTKPYIMIKTSKYCSKPSIKNLFWEIASSHGILPMHVKGNLGFGDNVHDILGEYLIITEKRKAFWCDRAAALDIARANEFEFKAINLDAAMFHFVKDVE